MIYFFLDRRLLSELGNDCIVVKINTYLRQTGLRGLNVPTIHSGLSFFFESQQGKASAFALMSPRIWLWLQFV